MKDFDEVALQFRCFSLIVDAAPTVEDADAALLEEVILTMLETDRMDLIELTLLIILLLLLSCGPPVAASWIFLRLPCLLEDMERWREANWSCDVSLLFEGFN